VIQVVHLFDLLFDLSQMVENTPGMQSSEISL